MKSLRILQGVCLVINLLAAGIFLGAILTGKEVDMFTAGFCIGMNGIIAIYTLISLIMER